MKSFLSYISSLFRFLLWNRTPQLRLEGNPQSGPDAEIIELRELNEKLRKQGVDSQNLVKRLEDENTRISSRLHKLEEQLRDATNAASRTRERLSLAERERDRLLPFEREAERLKNEIRGLTKQLGDKTLHLEQLQRESAAAQQWMSIRDAFTDAQIVESVQGLNYEIANVANALADSLIENMSPNPLFHFPADFISYYALDPHLIRLFQSSKISEDARATVLGIVIQTVLVQICYRLVSSWQIPTKSVELESWMENLFRTLFAKELAAISGNWRSMVHRYINNTHAQHLSKTNSEHQTTSLAKFFHDSLMPIAIVCFPSSLKAHSVVVKATGDSFPELAKLVVSLNKDIMEGVTSSCLRPTIVSPRAEFSPTSMKVGFGEAASSSGSKILCTTALGLERHERKEDGKIESKLLLPAEVALETVLAELSPPLPPLPPPTSAPSPPAEPFRHKPAQDYHKTSTPSSQNGSSHSSRPVSGRDDSVSFSDKLKESVSTGITQRGATGHTKSEAVTSGRVSEPALARPTSQSEAAQEQSNLSNTSSTPQSTTHARSAPELNTGTARATVSNSTSQSVGVVNGASERANESETGVDGASSSFEQSSTRKTPKTTTAALEEGDKTPTREDKRDMLCNKTNNEAAQNGTENALTDVGQLSDTTSERLKPSVSGDKSVSSLTSSPSPPPRRSDTTSPMSPSLFLQQILQCDVIFQLE